MSELQPRPHPRGRELEDETLTKYINTMVGRRRYLTNKQQNLRQQLRDIDKTLAEDAAIEADLRAEKGKRRAAKQFA